MTYHPDKQEQVEKEEARTRSMWEWSRREMAKEDAKQNSGGGCLVIMFLPFVALLIFILLDLY